MNPTIEVSQVDRVPDDARVCDYDELTGEATDALPNAVEHGTTTIRWRTAEQFAGIDVVRFTNYYHVAIAELQDSPEEGAAVADDGHRTEPRTLTNHGITTADDPLPESR